MIDFFNDYASAFNDFNAESIADLYKLPCTLIDGDGEQLYLEREELIKKFSANCNAMREMGYRSSKFKILSEQTLGDLAKAVTIAWRVYFHNSEIEFRAHYICVLTNNTWRIFNVTVYQGDYNNGV